MVYDSVPPHYLRIIIIVLMFGNFWGRRTNKRVRLMQLRCLTKAALGIASGTRQLGKSCNVAVQMPVSLRPGFGAYFPSPTTLLPSIALLNAHYSAITLFLSMI